jgi:plasmid stability protein
MRQLITRIDEELHGRLKARARAEGRSVNGVVTDLLKSGLAADHERERVFARLEAAGRRYIPTQPEPVPSLDEVLAITKRYGAPVIAALEDVRGGS